MAPDGTQLGSDAVGSYKSLIKTSDPVDMVEPIYISFYESDIYGSIKPHDRLARIAQSKMSPGDYSDFALSLVKLGGRTGALATLYEKQGLSVQLATEKAGKQIVETYRLVATLLEASDNPLVPIDVAGRSRLAQEIFEAKESGRLPLYIVVHSGNEPFLLILVMVKLVDLGPGT